MENKIEAARLLDILLSVPGMNEQVKIDFKLSRNQVLLLCNVMDWGLNSKEKDQQGLAEVIVKEDYEELKKISTECLRKAGLMEFNEKLKALSNSKA